MNGSNTKHRAGFVNIIGNPNVGKSTLMNALVGEKLSIVTAKAQTTRHRIMGIVNGDDYQIVYSDTPGILKPNYRLQQSMMNFVDTAIGDADIILYPHGSDIAGAGNYTFDNANTRTADNDCHCNHTNEKCLQKNHGKLFSNFFLFGTK